MDDLISRRKAIDLIENESRKWGDEYGVSDVLCDLADLPSADAVEVVRCKDCKWSERTDLFLLCGAWDARVVDNNDFCSSGERRSE